MKLPQLRDFNFINKRVLVRCDFDVPLRQAQGRFLLADDIRIKQCLPTIEYLLKNRAQVILLGHLGRPKGQEKSLSLAPVAKHLKKLLKRKGKVESISYLGKLDDNLYLLENLRFDKGEEKNEPQFAKKLAEMGDFYVNEAFASSHRKHASIVSLPKLLPHCAGFHFIEEVENLSKAIENPQRPLVMIIGGAKPEDKLPKVWQLAQEADFVLVGGTLVRERLRVKENVIFADLRESGLDISEKSVKGFGETIKKAQTIVWNGPMGKYEDKGTQEGTKKIAEAIVKTKAFKIVGGGDTIAALTKFGLLGKMDYVSTGGGAMLEFLTQGTLPGIEALKSN
ncbi:MAG TPA: phosphoglycerate kinase [Clostridia bacterium]|nr:phosphoglycerate kinase [Clostridia bacterium]